ncbi:MAG: family 78 glycoside hydrolase catalytic domain [bacterium]|nr:family 78 glycoside hydrolase catalytic domain [bacterium]
MFQNARWIWYDHYGYDDVNVYMLARKEFILNDIPEHPVEIKITADTRYKLYINEEYVCYGPARGYPENYPVDIVEISKYLKKGKNFIAIIVHQCGHGTFQSIYGGAGGLIVEGKIGEVDISTCPDNGWLVKKSFGHKQDMIRRSTQMGYQECFDARMTESDWKSSANINEGKDGWNSPKYRMAGCLPWLNFEERGIPLLKEEKMGFREVLNFFYGRNYKYWENMRNITSVYLEEIKTECRDCSKIKNIANMLREDDTYTMILPFPSDKHINIIFDAGVEVVGFLGVEVEGIGGEVIDFTTAELLNEEGHLCIKDTQTGSKVSISDRYILRKGKQIFETFYIHGFRYLSLTVRNVNKPLKIKRVYIREVSYPFEKKAIFKTSDEWLNQIWDMCIRTQICCSLDAYIDCPWREQAQWWGDARVQAVNTYYGLGGDMRLFRRGIRQAGQSQISNGLTYGHFPTIAVGCILPDFTMTWIQTHFDYYRYTGDKSLMKEQYDRIEKAMGFFNSYIEKNYLLGKMPEYWVFLDWAPLYKDGFSCLFNLMYLSTLRTMATISNILKKPEKANRYLIMAEKIEKRVKKVFWNNNKKCFWDGYDTIQNIPIKKISQHTHSLAILLDINRKYHRLWAEEILLPPMRQKPLTHPNIIEASPFFYYYVIEALKKVGGYEKQIMDFIKSRWGKMLDSGATTCWEMWNPDPGVTSLCHAWSAHPIVHFIEIIGGVRPVSYNWNVMKKYSFLTYINFAKLYIPTLSGDIIVEIEKDKRKIETRPDIKIL